MIGRDAILRPFAYEDDQNVVEDGIDFLNYLSSIQHLMRRNPVNGSC
jgi:hypothetical protein